MLLGHKKHLLNVQYRMHPTISQFPNNEFYNGLILDGPNVINRPRENRFLKGDMYGSYSFINVDSAKEEFDNNYSTRNMAEVAVIAEIVANLYKGRTFYLFIYLFFGLFINSLICCEETNCHCWLHLTIQGSGGCNSSKTW